ncbi:MAG: substrate-binding domain-containing protein, partial [Lachnospiraceae bacterium]|nr:substrate-binding domain-containing protein [Lachnospiraceae bacterium]
KAGGIPVIACDRIISGSDALSYYVATDSYATGVQQGRYIIEAMGLKLDVNSKEYHLEFAAGDPDDYRERYAFNGAYDTLKPYIDAGIVIVGSGQSSFTKAATPGGDSTAAQQRMRSIISSSYADGKILDMVVCADDDIAQAVIKALDDYKGKNRVIVTGQGGSTGGINAVRGKKQSMTTFLPPGEEAQVTGALGFAILCGDVTDANVIREGNWNFTCTYDTASYDNGSGIVPSFLITPVVITESNLKAEIIDKGYYVLNGDVLTEAGNAADK